jgi:hypothetical protein
MNNDDEVPMGDDNQSRAVNPDSEDDKVEEEGEPGVDAETVQENNGGLPSKEEDSEEPIAI